MQALAVCQFERFSLETICFHHKFIMRDSFSAAGCGLLPSGVTLPQGNAIKIHMYPSFISVHINTVKFNNCHFSLRSGCLKNRSVIMCNCKKEKLFG